MTPDMPEYPERLRQIKNKPKKLYYAGDISLLSGRCVSVVGSRTTNTYGRSTAEKIARQLAGKDVCVISGMARGIDTCVHKSVLAAGGCPRVRPGHLLPAGESDTHGGNRKEGAFAHGIRTGNQGREI